MTNPSADIAAEVALPDGASPPDSWSELRRDQTIQFEPVAVPEIEPREPGWLDAVFEFLAALFEPIGILIASGWPILKWVLLALALGLAALFVVRLVQGRIGQAQPPTEGDSGAEEWIPGEAESLALLSEADRLASEGRFDEATHLLLLRSVGQIAASRPDWVAPSSTARELIALPQLSDQARGAFQTIAERVERSMFALRSLTSSDWEAARSAYADFALAQIERERRP